MFKARFMLLRRHDQLDDPDQARFDKLFEAHPRLKAGWQALQELHGLYLANDHHRASQALDRFCDLYATGEIPEFHNIVNTIIAYSEAIFARHHNSRVSNVRIEVTNHLLQILRRTAHRFTNTKNFAARLLIT